jgi:acyl-coenzyme A synthetase/AMP-(fatty) acid ligase
VDPRAPDRPRRRQSPFYRWFPDGELKPCANALDRHVAGGQERSDSEDRWGGRGDQVALIYDSPLAGTKRSYTYRELLDEDGYLFVMGRTDDVINVAGHRLSTGAIAAVPATHPAVAECAVIGVADTLKGQAPEGPLGQDPGQDHARLRRRSQRTRALDDRGRRRPRSADTDPEVLTPDRDLVRSGTAAA